MANEPYNEVVYKAAQRTITGTPPLGQAVSASSVPVVIASDQSVVAVNQAGVTATGNITVLNSSPTSGAGTAGSAVALALNGATGWAVDIRGTFVATITFQGTIDGTNWFTINGLPAGGSVNVAAVSAPTAPGAWVASASGMQSVRATATAFTSGTATIVLRAMQAAGLVQNFPTGQTTQPVSGTVTLGAGAAAVGTIALGAGAANVGNTNLQLMTLVADVASAALTTTTTVAAITPAFGVSYQVNIPVTAVTGTNPTLDVRIEESDDTGTNWFTVYDFPRITATGIYRSPFLPTTGNRVRYVQTVGGTTPSFTRAVNRMQSNGSFPNSRQLIDRTVVPNTLNSVTPTLLARDCGNATQIVVNMGAITTTAPQFQLEGSDDFGATWYAIGTPLTGVASSTVQATVIDINAAALRARVSTAGVGATLGYVLIKAHD